jgi:hypothetical protein
LIDKTTEFTAQPVNQQTGPSLCYITLLVLSKEKIYILLYIFKKNKEYSNILLYNNILLCFAIFFFLIYFIYY